MDSVKGKAFTKGGFNAFVSMAVQAKKTADENSSAVSTLQTDMQALETAVSQLFTSVSDGKSLIASAITDKGVATAQDASFQTIRENILAIQTGDGTIVMNSLEIATPPDKIDYGYNSLHSEYIDPTGMSFVLHVTLVGMALALPVCPNYVSVDGNRHQMSYTVRPDAPEGMSNWPEVELVMSPDRVLQAGDTKITATVSWHGQTVSVDQPITVSHTEPTWADLTQSEPTWADMEETYDTWQAIASV